MSNGTQLLRPVSEQWPITAKFGKRGTLWKRGFHAGTDFGCPEGTPCLAAEGGEVQLAGEQGDSGLRVWVKTLSERHLYAHLSKVFVKVGEYVILGQEIGRTGKTGHVTGPHLHFEVRRLDTDEPIPPIFAEGQELQRDPIPNEPGEGETKEEPMGFFTNLAAKFAGKKIAKELDLQEGNMEGKPKWKSKAVWAAVITALLGAVQPISEALGHPISVPDWVFQVLIGAGLYGIRDAKKPLN